MAKPQRKSDRKDMLLCCCETFWYSEGGKSSQLVMQCPGVVQLYFPNPVEMVMSIELNQDLMPGDYVNAVG